jgi:hypothetical protein
MVYLLILILQTIGVGFHVMQKVISIGTSNPEKHKNEILGIFFQEDWDTLLVSLLILALDEVAHYVITHYAVSLSAYQYFDLISMGVALILGYAGQNLIYKWLGTAESFLDKKVTGKMSA